MVLLEEAERQRAVDTELEQAPIEGTARIAGRPVFRDERQMAIFGFLDELTGTLPEITHTEDVNFHQL